LLAGGFVDRVHVFVSPQIMGSDAVPAFKGLTSFIRMREVEVERYDNDLGLCSLLRDPWEDRDKAAGNRDQALPRYTDG
jgi:diaminohydroxyphosphoribosylaminopyrimidine deaminase / 5-amino-6-(5-phosphoribosylamino)uracil reductase